MAPFHLTGPRPGSARGSTGHPEHVWAQAKSPPTAQGLERGVLGRRNTSGNNLSLPANGPGKNETPPTPAVRSSRALRFPSSPGFQDTHPEDGGVGRLEIKGWKMIRHANVGGKEAEMAV